MLATLPSLDLGRVPASLPVCDRGERRFECCEGEGAERSPDCLVPVGVALASDDKSVDEALFLPSAKALVSVASYSWIQTKNVSKDALIPFQLLSLCNNETNTQLQKYVYLLAFAGKGSSEQASLSSCTPCRCSSVRGAIASQSRVRWWVCGTVDVMLCVRVSECSLMSCS